MRRLILRRGLWFVFTALIAAFVGLQSFVIDRIKANSVLVANAPCAARGVSSGTDLGNDIVKLKLDCGGRRDWTKDVKFVAQYLDRPRPFTCTLYENRGHAECTFVRHGA